MVRSTGIAARALTSVLAQEVRIDTGRGHSVLKKAERYWKWAYVVFSWESCLRRQGLRPWELSLLLPLFLITTPSSPTSTPSHIITITTQTQLERFQKL